MAKRLFIFRHAKSDWDAGLPDHERPLNARGRRAAGAMGRLLALSGQTPEAVICSSAARARATLELAADVGAWKCRVRVSESLYESTPERVLAEIHAEPDGTSSLMLVGHQPTWSDLTALLLGGGAVDFATGGMARIDFEVASWSEIGPGTGVLIWHQQPKFFTKGDFKRLLGEFEE